MDFASPSARAKIKFRRASAKTTVRQLLRIGDFPDVDIDLAIRTLADIPDLESTALITGEDRTLARRLRAWRELHDDTRGTGAWLGGISPGPLRTQHRPVLAGRGHHEVAAKIKSLSEIAPIRQRTGFVRV